MVELKIAGIAGLILIFLGVFYWLLYQQAVKVRELASQPKGDDLREGVESLLTKLEQEATPDWQSAAPKARMPARQAASLTETKTLTQNPPKAQTSKAGPRRATKKRGKK